MTHQSACSPPIKSAAISYPYKHALDLLIGLSLLTGIWLAVQALLLLSPLQALITNPHLHSGLFSILNAALIKQIMLYVLVYLGAWLVITLLIWATALAICICWQLREHILFPLGIGLWVMNCAWIISANSYYYPHSITSTILSSVLPHAAVNIIFILLTVTLVAALLHIGYIGLRYIYQRRVLRLGAIITSCIFLAAQLHLATPAVIAQPANHQPNIFIIGIDSLRQDAITPQLMPHLTAFLNTTTRFKHTFTPLGRTYPAWFSILTGQYPIHSGARYDLQDDRHLNKQLSLAYPLKALGYQTVYAIDERRFNNIDQRYGFTDIIGPKQGISDFLLGSLVDIPLLNLLANTAIGRYLLPYHHSNRATVAIYQPTRFTNMLKHFVAQRNLQSPLFMALHFCLPHYPYVWANSSLDYYLPETNTQRQQAYQQAIHAVDQQFADLIATLRHVHLLDHSIIVVLADHGESLEFASDSLTQSSHYHGSHHRWHRYLQQHGEPLNTALGHGHNLLSMAESEVLMAFKISDINITNKNSPGHISHIKNLSQHYTFATSLVDIKPTILALLGITNTHVDGISLVPFITQHVDSTLSTRSILMETGFWPDFLTQKLRQRHQFTFQDLVAFGMTHYQVQPDSQRVIIRPATGRYIIAHKRRAVIRYPWELVLVPTDSGYLPLLMNLQSLDWTDELNTRFAQHSPVKSLLQELTNYYAEEINQPVL
ncbi:MAG: sulfatase-like hydrolase/transferase [Gammaproteobacteria bacterium]